MQNLKQIRYQAVMRHLLFWLAYILYQCVNNGWEDKDVFAFKLDPQLVTSVPIAMLVTYLNLYVLMPLFYYPQKYLQYTIGMLGLILIAGLLPRFFAYAIWVPWDKIHDPAMYRMEKTDFWIPVRIFKNAAGNTPILLAAMLLKLMRNAFKQEKHLREVEQEKFTAEMGLLKAQINPHFFFNTLNSLYALTLKGSEQASKVVLRLSDLMHYMLYEASENKVLLQDEIKHLESYIGIEQMRFADRLELSFQYSGDIAGKMIAPLLLLPFVENAFKHGLAEHIGYITINLKVTGNRLFFKVENSYEPNTTGTKTGLGLKNVKRRLELTYPGNYTLLINKYNEIFEADLKLDL
ncbi:sensor histidine kinase [Mucilaginibacter dorajii]|uniref:Signal transduction histidine kinase internal region domain-containing protein n=1 Tax=Mucilaginibacter dorajii TaxID=692994 RepID=A0ABP7PE19_9SPHI|nr:histidine kinase [Mucilaginibacter dorajii]MCS3734614.1 signal transduction histidine kinase [Mucilaginibacter dorajii]